MLQTLLGGFEQAELVAIGDSLKSSREKMLLDHFLVGGAKDTLDELSRKEGITRNYLYKLERLLISRIYEWLRIQGHDVMDFLFERRLYNNFIHYCRSQEERLLAEEADQASLNFFYNRCFDYLIHFDQIDNLDLKLIREYGLKYSKTRAVVVPDDRLHITAVLIGLQLVLITSQKRLTLDKKRAKAEALLTKNQARFYRTKNVKAKYYYYLARSRYYSSYRQDKLESLLQILAKAESIITSYPEKFTEGERTHFALRMGRVYLIYNQHQKSYRVYKAVYERCERWKQFGIPNYLGYIRSLIQVDKYEMAYEALERASKDILNSGEKIFEVALELLYAEVMLHTEKYEQSLYHLQMVRSLMQGKVYYHNYESGMRLFHMLQDLHHR